MKKILLLTPTLPFPPVSGGVIKSNKVVQFLAGKYHLTVACFLKNEDNLYVQSFLETYLLHDFISEELNVARNAKNFVISNLQGIPLNIYRNKSATFKEKIASIINNYDVVFCDHYVMFQYIPSSYKGKIILHEHNCEYLIWKRYADIETNLIKKIALLNQAHRIKKYEQQICKQSTVILAAPNDTDELVKIGANPNKFLETYHLGDDSFLQEPNLQFEQASNNLLYIGTLSWEANIDGLLWFYKEIWPLVKHQHPTVKLYIIGKHADERIKTIAAEDDQIILTGFIEDVEPYFIENKVFIAPLRFGSGIKVKIVNALYRGIPCVTTSIGTEGLKTMDEEHIFIKDNAKDYAAAIHQLFTNKTTWEKLSTQSRQLANENYTWKYVLDNIEKAIES